MKLSFVAVGLAVLFLCGCRPGAESQPAAGGEGGGDPSGSIVRVWSAGSDAMASNNSSNGMRFRALAQLPETGGMKEAMAQSLARRLGWPGASASSGAETNPTTASGFGALLAETIRRESVLEMRERGPAVDWAIAFRTDTGSWHTNFPGSAGLSHVAGSRPFQKGGLAGMEIPVGGRWLRQVSIRPWVIVGLESGGAELVPALQQRLKAGLSGGQTNALWLQIDGNPGVIARLLQLPPWAQGPPAAWPDRGAFSVFNRGESVRVEGRLHYPKPLRLNLAPWQIPTNTIRDDQLVGFSALNSASTWFDNLAWVRQFKVAQKPPQLFFWSQAGMPLMSYAIGKVPDVTNVIRTAATVATNFLFQEFKRPAGNFLMQTNPPELVWTGLPAFIPFLRPAPAPEQNFLLGGLFLSTLGTNPLPAALINQVTRRDNLLYYGWEITEVRLLQWRSVLPLLDLLVMAMSDLASVPRRLAPVEAAQNWLAAASSLFGESVTEITVAGPQELAFLRKGHSGLTALELFMLARWLTEGAGAGAMKGFLPHHQATEAQTTR